MKVSLTKKLDMPLVGRQEVIASVEFAGEPAPSNQAMQMEVVKLAKSQQDCVVIKKLDARFGATLGTIKAYVYKSPEDKARFEPPVKSKDQTKEGEAQAEAKPAEKK